MSRLHKAFKGQGMIVVCLCILTMYVAMIVCAPWIAPHDPVKVDLSIKLQPSSYTHPLGTDHLGRDNLSRLIYGAKTSFGLVLITFMASLTIGLLIGTISGYIGGWLDNLIMRVCDGIMAFPHLVLVLGIVGITGPGIIQIFFALLLVQWVFYARMSRGLVVSLRERQFITAARISGSSTWTIIRKHVVPNITPQIVVIGTLEIGWAIMDISALSFLGLGIQPPTPEWGAMIQEGKAFIRSNPELMIYPGIFILVLVTTFNLLGEALSSRLGVKKQY
ncbi:nickel ABC transporter permease subunit NikC [Paenibacillus odorifer]|uniref:nickel ABC transporter permease subunit NikC n=1 Tax=Paenibacillus odorifer TaxID=189426 RepID=UPI00289EAE40|nr:nickel ABC transporter permease subunit NikC [Paenibacillus odorifer]